MACKPIHPATFPSKETSHVVALRNNWNCRQVKKRKEKHRIIK
jgi:hypothetical protein